MYRVGITGGIGAGKSTVASFFEALGIPVYYSDREAKKLYRTDGELRREVIALFGEQSYDGNRLDTKFIASQVFSDKEKLDRLNALVHPRVAKHFADWAAAQSAPYVIKESALLLQGNSSDVDLVIVVQTDPEERIRRVMARDGVSRKDVLERIDRQMNDPEMAARADIVINSTSFENSRREAGRIHCLIMESLERDLSPEK